MINGTFRPIFRDLLNSRQFQNPYCLKVWIWCLLKATDNPCIAFIGRQEVPLSRGQFIFGRKVAAEELDMSPSTAWFWMGWLRDAGSLDIKSNNKYSIISISKQQKWDDLLNSLLDNRKTTERQQKDTYKKDKKEKKERLADLDFDQFYQAFPNKKGKLDAQKAWTKIEAMEIPAILTALEHQKKSLEWLKEGGRFIPHPATWLNGRRWEDQEIEQEMGRQDKDSGSALLEKLLKEKNV